MIFCRSIFRPLFRRSEREVRPILRSEIDDFEFESFVIGIETDSLTAFSAQSALRPRFSARLLLSNRVVGNLSFMIDRLLP